MKGTEIVIIGVGAYVASAPQPKVFIFTKSHYRWMWLPGNRTKGPVQGAVPTTDEKVAAFDSLAGTYEVNGSSVTFRPIVVCAIASWLAMSLGSFA